MNIDMHSIEMRTTIEQIDSFLQKRQKMQCIPGLSFAVICNQQILWSKGFGFANIRRNIATTPQTVYRIASVTKLFTATMLMQLRDAGKLHLDEPLMKYLPEWKVKSYSADASPITFRQVAAHVAGLPRDDSLKREYAGNVIIFPSTEQIQAHLKELELIAAPMTKIHYSNLGFALLGLVLEQIVEQPYTHYVTDQILRPLGMGRSGFEPLENWPLATQAYLATPYDIPQESETIPSPVPELIERGINPAGGLYCSVEDMAHFISLQFLNEPVKEQQILKGSTLREMHAPVFLESDWNAATGIGWRIERFQNYTTIGHNGRILGFSADILLVPSLKLGLALFANTMLDTSEMNRIILGFLLNSTLWQ